MTQPDFEPNRTSDGSVADQAADPTAQQADDAAYAAEEVAAAGAVGSDTADEAPQSAEAEETPEQSLQRQLDERTADLQRLQAEYVNYRRRVERDRMAERGRGKADVLKSLLTVLDDLDRAEKHGELVGGFKAVAGQIWDVVRGHQLEPFGQVGDVFDARLHEALYHTGRSSEVSETSIGQVVKAGYRLGDDIIRHAEVGVVEPEPAGQTSAEAGAEPSRADTSAPGASETGTTEAGSEATAQHDG